MSCCMVDIWFSGEVWGFWQRFEVVGEKKKKLTGSVKRSCLISPGISDFT